MRDRCVPRPHVQECRMLSPAKASIYIRGRGGKREGAGLGGRAPMTVSAAVLPVVAVDAKLTSPACCLMSDKRVTHI